MLSLPLIPIVRKFTDIVKRRTNSPTCVTIDENGWLFILSCRGEGGVEWPGGPLWSPAVPLMDEELNGLKIQRSAFDFYAMAVAS